MIARRRKPRGNKPLPTLSINVDKWLDDHPGYMIECEHQPGNLKLSAEACAKRFVTANDPRWSSIGAEPFPIFVIKMNLIPCRNCATGAQMAKKHKVKAA